MPRPFVLLQARPAAADRAAELAAMRVASGLGPRLVPLRVDAETVPPHLLDEVAGVLAGGSPYSLSDPEEAKGPGQRLAEAQLTAVVERALETGAPAFLTCFGIGIVTRVLGGVVDRTHPEPVSAAESRLTAAGRDDEVAGVLPSVFLALTGHKESAPAVPPGAVLLATNDTSPVQLYRAGSVLASQFHPEPTIADFVERARVYSRHGYFPEEELPAISAVLHGARVTAPAALLRRFAQLHGDA
ncbi:glutamine amidotransferase-related protein [Amnibacterium endophyticum]|uniref:Glutamine amidotransferase domain-containing protein n=1 Tax=Amnibacterium endophyticum TaxID=2109337 RepID=A0ABW4LLL3_9MICO